MIGTSDAWSMSRSSHWPSDPAYYIEDCRILTMLRNSQSFFQGNFQLFKHFKGICILGGNCFWFWFKTNCHTHCKTESRNKWILEYACQWEGILSKSNKVSPRSLKGENTDTCPMLIPIMKMKQNSKEQSGSGEKFPQLNLSESDSSKKTIEEIKTTSQFLRIRLVKWINAHTKNMI